MRLPFLKNTFLLFPMVMGSVCFSCGSQNKEPKEGFSETVVIHDSVRKDAFTEGEILTGAERPQIYLPFLEGKNVGIVANQTSVISENSAEKNGYLHLVDYLIEENIKVGKVFAPEHGFRGTADAGEMVKDGTDTKTGLPIVSLYGKNKKPSPAQLEGIDIMVFDIQDVGARFYTYISTLHYVMEACAEAGIPVVVLDRPNPNGHYIDGPILEPAHKSFVGMHPVPVVHGMTMGEYAQMINGEGWLAQGAKCDLTVVPMKNYDHQTPYSLPIKPSPNLPNDRAINLYPSLCFFEGTTVSVGRGTGMQFQVFGAPFLPSPPYGFRFTPQPNPGASHPKHQGLMCHGKDLRDFPRLNNLNLEWLIEAYTASDEEKSFFTPYFTTLAGTEKLQQQIEQGLTYREIRKTWLEGLNDYKQVRKKYLLYP